MYPQVPLPITCAAFGSLAGLIAGGCNQCFPVWVGASTGVSVGCAFSIFLIFCYEPPPAPVEQVVVQNIYITYVSGDGKDIPVAKVVES